MASNGTEYPITELEEPVRPIKLWDAKEKHCLAHRHFSNVRNAHMAALVEARWADVGRTIEVFDSRTGKLFAQYTRRVNDIHIYQEGRGGL